MFRKFFQKNKNEIAIAFVDYEYWLFSYLNLFGFEPDIQTWHKNLQEHYRNLKVYIFADFSKPQMRKEAESINRIADNVVDICAKDTQKPVKDFLMLDSIFRLSTMQGAPDTIILFTGSRMYRDAVEHLVRNLGKKVIVHGIKESFSWQLKEVATEIVTFPSKEECDTAYIKLIVENLCFVSCRHDIYSTYAGTIRAVSKHSKIPEKCVADALSKMLELGYVHTKTLDDDRHQAMLIANWKKLMDAGYYKPENHDRDPGSVL